VWSWHGQEDDIIEDILQETARRLIERRLKVDLGEAAPIQMLERMAIATAYNYCQDMRRRDCRLIRLIPGAYLPEVHDILNESKEMDLSASATECVYQESLFTLLAQEIAHFPEKQQRALLVDLANRMSFEEQLTPLQKAFLNVGISLKEYQQTPPENAKERSRNAALLHYAYKRITQLSYLQKKALLA